MTGRVLVTAAAGRRAAALPREVAVQEYELNHLDDAIVVRWVQTPTAAAATSLYAELDTALRAAPSKLALWVVIAGETDPPPPDARAVLQDRVKEFFQLARSVDVVIIGDGLRMMLMRTVLRGMALVTRTSDRLHVHEGIEQAANDRGIDEKLLEAMRGAA